MNDDLDYDSFSTKGKNFVVSVIFSNNNRLDEQNHPYGLSYYGNFLGVLRSNFSTF